MLLFQRALALSLVLASAIGASDDKVTDKKLRGRGISGTLREANDVMKATGDHTFGLDVEEGSERRLAVLVENAPQAEPTIENCSSRGDTLFELSITTDNYPEDTFWMLKLDSSIISDGRREFS